MENSCSSQKALPLGLSARVNVSVPLSGIIPISIIPFMGTAIPLTTTAAACGHPRCLGSVTVGERQSLVRTAQLCLLQELKASCCAWCWWWQIAAVLCLAQVLFSPMWRWLSHKHGCPSLMPHWTHSLPSVPHPYILCSLWTCSGPSWSPLLSCNTVLLRSGSSLSPFSCFQQLACLCSQPLLNLSRQNVQAFLLSSSVTPQNLSLFPVLLFSKPQWRNSFLWIVLEASSSVFGFPPATLNRCPASLQPGWGFSSFISHGLILTILLSPLSHVMASHDLPSLWHSLRSLSGGTHWTEWFHPSVVHGDRSQGHGPWSEWASLHGWRGFQCAPWYRDLHQHEKGEEAAGIRPEVTGEIQLGE